MRHFHRNQEGGQRRRRPQYGPRRPKHNVPVNIEETENGFEARVYCVTFAKEDVKIQLTDNLIYISGTRRPENDRPDFLLQEYPIKSFERWFELSEAVDQAAITARFEDGVLVITAPKIPEAQRPEREVVID
ncbi:Hsp20/alpha crystallin family protein [Neolewinella litorea]|uniref:Hsp20/alpha crystallin family protein n=1 Tax=Neolewinella litorea TaxID=2562452 RepID=A0A4S4NPR7_9BACT|nr:Hsp20/alpha crystallin family protein [Neolewinella litorea]THH40401.1 Hsp20/alpha crystallin family protein [Neolewinella litorea]